MLMPLGDDNRGRLITPYVTFALIAINVLVFLFLQMPNNAFTYGYSVVPTEIMRGRDLVEPALAGRTMIPQAPGPAPIYLTILSAMFMHGGWMHIIGNMLYLWIFGDNVEEAMGHGKFLAFYLLCGVIATAAHIIFNVNSVIPSLGASGAIAGVLGGYLLMFPSRRVRVLIGLGIVTIVELPAIIVIGFWGLVQLLSGMASIVPKTAQTDDVGGVAYMAHVGGFVAGLLLVSLFRNREVQQRAQQLMQYPARRSSFD